MAATIRGTFELIDRASNTLQKIERQALKTQAAVEGVGVAMDAQGSKSSKASQALNNEGRALQSLESDLKGARSESDRLSSSHTKLASSSAGSGRAIRSFASDLETARRSTSGLAGDTERLRTSMTGLGNSGGGTNAFKQLGQAANEAGRSFSGLGSVISAMKFPLIGSAIQPAIAAIDALGSAALGLTSTLMNAAKGIQAYPAALSVLAQGLGTLKLATSGVGQALSTLQTTQASYGQSQQQFQQQVQSATDAVTSAQQGLTSAMYAQNQAQLNLTITRQQATRTLQDMAFAAKTSVLQEAQAGLNIQQAQQTLQQAMMTPGTSSLTLEQDRLSVLQAQADAQQTHTQAIRSRQDYHAAERKSPTSAPIMQVAQAQHQLAQSNIDVKNAEHQLAEAQQSLNITMHQGSSGAQQYQQALNKLAPAQQQFVNWVKGSGLMQDFKNLQNAAGKGFFPAVEGGLKRVIAVFPQLDKVAQRTGTTLGQTFEHVLNVFADPNWITNVGDENAKILEDMGDGLTNVARIMKALIPAGQQFVDWVVKLAGGWLKNRAQIDNTTKGMDALKQKFDTAESAIKKILTVAENLWHTFTNVMHAATGFGNELWTSMEKGTKGWADWTASTKGQNDMKKYFEGMRPTLHALGKLLGDLLKDFVDLGKGGGQSSATNFITQVDKLLPSLTQIISGMGTWVNALGPATRMFATTLAFISKLVGDVLKIKPLADALGIVAATAVLGRFIAKLSGISTIVKGIGKLFLGGTGLFSPGTGTRSVNPVTNQANAISLSEQWGMRSGDGPGSETNPLAVVVLAGGGGGGIPGAASTAVKDAEEATRAEKAGAWLADKPGGKVLSKVLGKIPGLGGVARGAGLAGDAAEVGQVGRIAGALGKTGEVLGKVAIPLAVVSTALPGIIAGVKAPGNVGDKATAGLAAAVNALTIGLTHFHGLTTAAGQHQQGMGRAQNFFSNLPTGTSGLLTKLGTNEFKTRLATLKQQYSVAAGKVGGPTTIGAGQVGSGSAQTITDPNFNNPAVRQDRFAQIKTLEAQFNAEQAAAGAKGAAQWQNAFTAGINNGQKPMRAMNLLINGLGMTVDKLNPAGRKSLLQSMTAWGATIVQNNPKMKGPINDLNQYIEQQFQAMGQQVQIVNGQILTGSTSQWQSIYKALTDPMAKAQAQLAGDFGKITQAATGELMAMGLPKSAATALMKNPASANSWVKFYHGGGSPGPSNKASHGHGGSRAGGATAATGGRVVGGDPHDAYAFGNMTLGGGELVVNRHQESKANAIMRAAGGPTLGAIVSSSNTPHWAYATGGRTGHGIPAGNKGGGGGGGGGWNGPVVLDPGVNMTYGQEPSILADLHKLAGELRQTVYVISGYRSPAHSVAVGGFPNDPHTRGQAADIGIGGSLRDSMLKVRESQLRAVGLYRPFYPASASEVNHVQLLAGGSQGKGSVGVPGGGGGGGGVSFVAPTWHDVTTPQIQGVGGIPLVANQRAVGGFAANLNAILGAGVKKFGHQLAPAGTGGGVSIPGGGGAVVAQMARVLMANGLNKIGAAGIIGNALQESGWNPAAMEPGTHNGGLWGFTTSPVSLSDMQAYAASHHKPWTDPSIQTAFLLTHITGSDKQAVNTAGSPEAAADWFMSHWERPLVSSENAPRREQGARQAFNMGYATGGRIPANAGWFARGGSFITSGPTVFGAGERGPEHVTITPNGGGGGRPVTINIQRIEVNRKGDVQKIVDEEMRILANSLRGQ